MKYDRKILITQQAYGLDLVSDTASFFGCKDNDSRSPCNYLVSNEPNKNLESRVHRHKIQRDSLRKEVVAPLERRKAFTKSNVVASDIIGNINSRYSSFIGDWFFKQFMSSSDHELPQSLDEIEVKTQGNTYKYKSLDLNYFLLDSFVKYDRACAYPDCGDEVSPKVHQCFPGPSFDAARFIMETLF